LDHGQPILSRSPPDQKLAAQLCSVHFTVTANGIAAEDKVAVIKRLGRSPDKADAVVMAWYRGVSGGYARLSNCRAKTYTARGSLNDRIWLRADQIEHPPSRQLSP